MNAKEANQIVQFMIGRWLYSNGKSGADAEDIYVGITNEFLEIKRKRAGVEDLDIRISSNAHWYDRYLVFTMENQRYYLRQADGTNLIFGENQQGLIGSKIWEHAFTRVEV